MKSTIPPGRADVFDCERHTAVARDKSYIVSYPYILSYFECRDVFEAADLVRGAHIAYGWMPTVLDLYPGPPNITLDAGAELLTRAKRDGVLSNSDIKLLATAINHSLVGASKLLHFVAPEKFAIWDSKIYAFLFGQAPHNYRLNDPARYRDYLDTLATIRTDGRFGQFHSSVNGKVGYDVSALRAIELIMFLNAPAIRG